MKVVGMNKDEKEKKILTALDKIRPYLQADGGDIKLLEFTDDLIVKVEMTGACDGCPFSMHTLKAGVEEAIKKELPEIKEVQAVNM
jgi:Fe-S cluster biogenesis protein NfuA